MGILYERLAGFRIVSHLQEKIDRTERLSRVRQESFKINSQYVRKPIIFNRSTHR